MKAKQFILPSVALGTFAFLMLPTQDAQAFSKLGGNLNNNQRDLRVFDNFTDSRADNNTRGFVNFPGQIGLELAMWKGAAEWNSFGRVGDATQTQIGDGGANFDVSWQGKASGVGDADDNIASAINNCQFGVIAFAESPFASGWRIRFCQGNFIFHDGPGTIPGNGFDIQGIMTHEYGHALGLGHSNVGGTTMFASGAPGTEFERSIEPDDIAGLQCIYSVEAAGKPTISAVSVDENLNEITITGTNFSSDPVNEVWFTNGTISATNINPRIRVLSVAATGGGTSITVTIPADAGAGEVLVRVGNTTAHDTLSNAFPTDLGEPFFGESVFFNGGGGNPTCFTVTGETQLNTPLDMDVDASGHPGGAGFSGVLIYSQCTSGVFIAAGELLVDLGSNELATLVGVSSGATDSYSTTIPDDVDLLGATATAQGFTFNISQGLRLCNAEKLVVGARP